MSGSGDTREAASNSPVEVDFSPDPGFKLLFDGLHAEEEMGRPFLIHLELSSGKMQPKASDLIGSACTIWMYQAESKEEKNRYFHGIVTRLVSTGLSGGAYRFKVELRPWVWLLSQITDCRIFQKKSAFDIVTTIFRDAGFSDFEDKRQGGAGDIELEYCVQYRETSLAFITRLMEQFGFYYYFTFTKSAHTLVIADDPNGHTLLDGEMPFHFDQTEFRLVADHIWQWAADLELNSGKWTFQDYNFETPAADLTAKTVQTEQHRYGSFEVYEYPGPYDTAQTGHRLSDVRMQAIIRQRKVFSSQSNSRKLHAGWRFKLSEHPDKPNNREYLIIKSVTIMGSAEGTPTPEADSVDTYRVDTQSIPGDTAFRLMRSTPRPLIRGPQTARVVGKPGDEITTDEHGRIKVRFHWDRSSTQDEERTCWIRVAQTWASGSWGAMFIPRVGQEVVVEFLEGNPDRPLITGVVYNANNKVPHGLPDNKTRSTIKTNSSPGGSGFNELRFEDKAGEEEIYMHAQYDYKREVLHDEKADITNDRTITVSSGNDSLTVSTGNHTTTISSGNHTITVSAGKSEVTAAQSITLTVGGSSIKIDPSGVTISAPQVQVTASASMTLNGGGSMSLSAGMISIN